MSKPFTLARTEQVLLQVSACWLAGAMIYAFVAGEYLPVGMTLPGEWQTLSALRDLPALFLLSLSGGFGLGALCSIALRRGNLLNTEKS